MPIQIGRAPDHSFEQPLGLLSDCHRRIEHFLKILVRVDADLSGGPLTDDYRRALDAALRYFETAAPRHTADEEDSLFPRLRASDDPAAQQALALVDRLEHDHQAADVHHAAANTLVRRWLDDNRLVPADAAALRDHLAALQTLYAGHIAVEDHELFPAAARLLDAPALQQIGREMAARRGLR
ncbi:MAG: hemerythrin domain-containing protein [Acidobacteriota bacterium]|nr:hemerythrin domain-containing protein [Acidobacteriota bacterium]